MYREPLFVAKAFPIILIWRLQQFFRWVLKSKCRLLANVHSHFFTPYDVFKSQFTFFTVGICYFRRTKSKKVQDFTKFNEVNAVDLASML